MNVRNAVPVVLALVVFVVAWKLVVVVSGFPPYILPPPESVAERFVEAWADGIITPHALATVREVIAGFTVGAGLAVACGRGVIAHRSTLARSATGFRGW